MYDICASIKEKDILLLIRTKKFVIYGSGYIGKRFFRCVINMGCSDNVDSFAITGTVDRKDIYGVNVKSIYDIPKDSLVIIAAHDANALEMENTLRRLGINDYIWIYPFILNLELGEPIRLNCQIPVKELLSNITGDYMPAIYYFSLKDYCGNNNYDGSLYIKMSAHYVTVETGIKRWKRFCKLIEKCKKEGFVQDTNIYLDDCNKLIDGLHRLVLARYFGVDTLLCNVYHSTEEFYSENGIGGNICIGEKELEKYFDGNEVELIKKANLELRK